MMVLFGRNVLSLFVSGEPDQTRQVLDIAYKYLFIMAVFFVGAVSAVCVSFRYPGPG